MDINKVFQYAAANQCLFEEYWQGCGHERKTTFFSDLSIAELFGVDSIQDTYARVMKEWINNLVFITEFIACLGVKASQWAGKNESLCGAYSHLYAIGCDQFYKHYANNEDAKSYFFEMTD